MRQATKAKSVKEDVLEMIQRLPDDCTLDDIQYHLYVRQVVEEGQKEIDAGKAIPHEEASEG
jgi:hypothetical protein